MHHFIDSLLREVFYNSGFRLKQNAIAQSAYDTLTASYNRGDNEVAMVTRLCDDLHGKDCGKAKIYAKKVHGNSSSSGSMVTFYNGSRKTMRELADMVIISMATHKAKVIFEKIAFVQNKKETAKEKWKIDQDQLYLLHNLPTFDGVSGIFGKQKDIALPNAFGRLGNYGLFIANGDMVFANAAIINALQNKETVSLDSIRKETTKNKRNSLGHFPFDPMLMEEFYHCNKHSYWMPLFAELPILGNCEIALNLYQFIRNWTQFNIGETTICRGRVISGELVSLADTFIKGSGIRKDFDYYRAETNDRNEWNIEFDGAVFVLHYDVGND